jgi:hypothetical protein
MNTLSHNLSGLILAAALTGWAAAACAGVTPPVAAGVGAGTSSSGNTGATGTVNGNRNPDRRSPTLPGPSNPSATEGAGTDALQQQRQQSGEQMIQERKGQGGDTR